jgi:uroporphyrinogen-III synthase
MKVVNLRPLDQSQELRNLLIESEMGEIAFPTLEIRPADDLQAICATIENKERDLCLVFTSQNAVSYVSEILSLKSFNLVAIGQKTKAKIQSLGADVHFCPSAADSETLATELLSFLQEKSQFLHLLRGNTASDVLPKILSEHGVQFSRDIVYYSTCPSPDSETVLSLARRLGLIGTPSLENSQESTIIAATSSLALKNLQRILSRSTDSFPEGWLDKLFKIPVCCIGPGTANVAEQLGYSRRFIAKEATVESLVHKLIEYRSDL